MELLFATLLGFLSGFFVGALPGISVSTFLLISFPFLIQQSFLFCIVYYCCLMSVCQYFGSVTALTFGVPGETTSLPLLEIRKKLIDQKLINQAHFLCAFGSLISFILSSSILVLIFDFFYEVIFYLKTYVSLIFIVFGIILCIIYSNNEKKVSILLIIIALILGKIGYDPIYNINFLTFDNPYLYSGLPVLPVILGIYAIPNLIKITYEIQKLSLYQYVSNEKIEKFILCLRYTKSIVRAFIIGFICGLIPYVGNSISSYMAFLIEKKINFNDHISHAVAAESSNNSASISVLIPLLFLGIAIIPSEFILLEIFSSMNVPVIWKSISLNFTTILLYVFLANILAFLFSWNLIHFVNTIIFKMKTFFPIIMSFFIVFNIYYIGTQSDQELYYMIVLIIFSFMGICLYKYDLLPFVYMFLLQNNIDQIVYRLYKIYFE